MSIPYRFQACFSASTTGSALGTAVLGLLLLGLVMTYSASIALPDAQKYAAYARTHFLVRQALYIAAALLAGWLVMRIPLSFWQDWSSHLFMFALLLLLLVYFPWLGKGVNGARRWIHVPGVTFQPSELMKLAMVLYVSAYAVRRQAVLYSLTRGFGPVSAVVAAVGVLLIFEPDLGAFGVIVAIAMGVLFIGGINAIWFGGLCLSLTGFFVMLVAASPWRRARVFAYMNPWEENNALGKAYQLSHSLIAFGRGELFGVGLGASVEKLHYLPEAHTDFLLAVIGEELGFVGVMVVICAFYLIVKSCFVIGRRAIDMERHFAGLVAQGIGIWIGVQSFINMAVALGLLPTKGLTLPFMSYGGSGLLANCIAVAIVLRIEYETLLAMGLVRTSANRERAAHQCVA